MRKRIHYLLRITVWTCLIYWGFTNAVVPQQDGSKPTEQTKLEDSDPEIKHIIALAKENDEKNIPAFKEALSHKNKYVRYQAAFALALFEDLSAVPVLVEAVDDFGECYKYSEYGCQQVTLGYPSEDFARQLSVAFSYYDAEDILPVLYELFKNALPEKQDLMLKTAFQDIFIDTEWENYRLIDILHDGLLSDNEKLQRFAIQTLTQLTWYDKYLHIPSFTSEDVLLKALYHENNYVRYNAAIALCDFAFHVDNPYYPKGVEGPPITLLDTSLLAKIKPVLIEALSSTDAIIRSDAIKKLKWVATKEILPEFKRLLRDDEIYVREEAIKAIAITPDASFVAPLITTLSDDWQSVAVNAAWALGQIGDKSAIPSLKEVFQRLSNLKKDNSLSWVNKDALKFNIAITLALLGDKSGYPLIQETLMNNPKSVSSDGIYNIGNTKDPIFIPFLKNTFLNGNWDAHGPAVNALLLMGEKGKDTIWELADDQKNGYIAFWALVRSGYPRAIKECENAIQENKDETESVPSNCSYEFTKLKLKETVPSIILTAKNAHSSFVRDNAFANLKLFGDMATDALLKATNDDAPHIRAMSLTLLGRLKNKKFLSIYMNALKYEDDNVKSAAILALGQLGKQAQKAMPLLKALLSKNILTEKVLEALGNIGDPSVIPVIEQYLTSPETRFRPVAAKALYQLGDKKGMNILVDAIPKNPLLPVELNMTDDAAVQGLKTFYQTGKTTRSASFLFNLNYCFTKLIAATRDTADGTYWAVFKSMWYGGKDDLWVVPSKDKVEWGKPIFTGVVTHGEKPNVSVEDLDILIKVDGDKIILSGRQNEVVGYKQYERKKSWEKILSKTALLKDTDKDLMPDVEEIRFGTDPEYPDTDNDKLPDGFDLNPLVKPGANLTDAQMVRQALFAYKNNLNKSDAVPSKVCPITEVAYVITPDGEKQEFYAYNTFVLNYTNSEWQEFRKRTGMKINNYGGTLHGKKSDGAVQIVTPLDFVHNVQIEFNDTKTVAEVLTRKTITEAPYYYKLVKKFGFWIVVEAKSKTETSFFIVAPGKVVEN